VPIFFQRPASRLNGTVEVLLREYAQARFTLRTGVFCSVRTDRGYGNLPTDGFAIPRIRNKSQSRVSSVVLRSHPWVNKSTTRQQAEWHRWLPINVAITLRRDDHSRGNRRSVELRVTAVTRCIRKMANLFNLHCERSKLITTERDGYFVLRASPAPVCFGEKLWPRKKCVPYRTVLFLTCWRAIEKNPATTALMFLCFLSLLSANLTSDYQNIR